jgi:hypothetical protein
MIIRSYPSKTIKILFIQKLLLGKKYPKSNIPNINLVIKILLKKQKKKIKIFHINRLIRNLKIIDYVLFPLSKHSQIFILKLFIMHHKIVRHFHLKNASHL